ncbi:helix-turn-helix transcriptional regulator [Nocardia carnea]|uniref:AAA family ATPase n=1 Tax=Nocardia carnea TaxID=37328 RepID=A0ABW7TZK7_9NOCA|nr:AAA family ATPase [Nocardia carnea]
MLHGRDDVIEQIATLIDDSRDGRGNSVLITGGPGQGKTTLLDHAANSVGEDWIVLRCCGTEQEAGLRYGGLHQLLAPIPDAAKAVPEPTREASPPVTGTGPLEEDDNSHRVGLGLLTLLSRLSAERPVLFLIDDAHWWDQPSLHALAFATRRLTAHRAAVLVTSRARGNTCGLPETELMPLSRDDSKALLTEQVPGLAADTCERVLDTAAGNPSALLQLPGANSGLPPLGPLALTDHLQREYEREIRVLPEETRIALLVVAADCSGSLIVAVRVLTALGSTTAALDAAERIGVVTISGYSITFRHPLERAAAYRMAPYSMRLFIHATIAASIDDPELRAWHLAAAATAPDEAVAAALDAVADSARWTNDYRRAAIASEYAGRLSPAQDDRHHRLLVALEADIEAGQADRALELAEEIASEDGGFADAARLSAARGRILSARGDPRGAYDAFTEAAHLCSANPDAAARMHIYAAGAVWPDPDPSRILTTRAAVETLPPSARREGYLAVLDGQLALHNGRGDRAQAVRTVRDGIRLGRARFPEDHSVQFVLAVQAMSAGEVDDAHARFSEVHTMYRERGMAGRLPLAGIALGAAETLLGQFRKAETVFSESLRTAHEIGQPDRAGRAGAGLAVLAAVRGEHDLCRRLAEENLPGAASLFDTTSSVNARWALGLLDLGYGRHEAALAHFEAASDHRDQAIGCWIPLISDHIEAAARCDPEQAGEPMSLLERWHAANSASWIEAQLLRCRGLLEQDGAAFAQALALHADTHRWFDHARTGLLYGEWLRRERFTLKARTVLHTAMRTFVRLGALPWAERARTELRAAGEGTPAHAGAVSARLTAQELQVVRLAAGGATNRQIAARLHISPKTVSHHLYRAFPKLGVSNRRALARLPLDLDDPSDV